jgi:hypothetical protein
MYSSPGNNLLQKCRKRLYIQDPKWSGPCRDHHYMKQTNPSGIRRSRWKLAHFRPPKKWCQKIPYFRQAERAAKNLWTGLGVFPVNFCRAVLAPENNMGHWKYDDLHLALVALTLSLPHSLYLSLLEKWFMVTSPDFLWCRLVTVADT